jgi:uncharacterized protein YdaU (DUF1376 family)
MKDPAALLYIDTWLTATAEMDADTRGWYLNLILHQYDKKDLPNDIERLAVLANVKFSEFDRFKQVFEQVFKQKFKQNSEGRLENEIAKEILRKREQFKDKRSMSGKMSYFLRYINKHFKPKKEELKFIKENVDLTEIDLKNKQVIEQVFEQILKLYINGNKNNSIKDINIVQTEFYNSLIPFVSEFGKEIIREFYDYWSEPNKSKTAIRYQMEKTWDTHKRLLRWSKNNFGKQEKQKQSNQPRTPAI